MVSLSKQLVTPAAVQVCGQYIDEAKKYFLENYNQIVRGLLGGCASFVGAPIACPALAAAIAAKAILEKELAEAKSDTIDKFFNSSFVDITTSKNRVGPYRCEKIKVRSTGNYVVDRVRERLSYNDIQVRFRNSALVLRGVSDHACCRRSLATPACGRLARHRTRPCTTRSTPSSTTSSRPRRSVR